jgi:predicted dehydrogenase
VKNADNILRIGGIGTGRIFQGAHQRAYPSLLRRGRLVGFFDLNRERAKQAKAKYAETLEKFAAEHPELAEEARQNIGELKTHDSLDSLFKQVDLVDVATHARGRMPSAIAAFEAGVNVMAEKPMARTWTEADRAARVLARKKGVLFQLNDDNAFEPKYRNIADLIKKDEIGRVQTLSLIRGSRLDSKTVLKAQANALENGGGCLMDYGSHGLAGALTILGPDYKPVKVEAVSIAVNYPHRVLEDDPVIMEVEDNARVKVLLENGETGSWATIFIEATWCGGHIGLDEEKPGSQNGGYLQAVGDKGIIESNSPDLITLKTWDGGVSELPLRVFPGETVSVVDEMGSFMDAIRTGGEPELPISFGAEIIAICGAAYYSALKGRAVTLEEFKDFSRGFVKKLGDNEKADDAIVLELLKPYKRRMK